MSIQDFNIILPKEKAPVERVNPATLALFGLPKCGKTTALSNLQNCLVIDTEEGSDFSSFIKVKVPIEYGPVKKFEWLKALSNKIRLEDKPYDYVAIDTFTMIDEWAEWVGTYRYMSSTQGQKFNRYGKDNAENPDQIGKKLPADHPDYESVHTVGQGFGYRWSREAVLEMYDTLYNLGRICTIFVCHVADKSIVSKLTNQEVLTRDLALTGKVKDILARKVDAIGYVYNSEGAINISFKGNEERIGGIRAKHIQGYDGPLEWKKIFI